MSKDLIAKHIWIVDTLKRHKALSREQLSALWQRDSVANGNPLPERTFHHYRRGIEQIFNIDILCNKAGEYYIDDQGSRHVKGLSDWLLDSMAVTEMLQASHEVAERVEVEEVPSAREHLPTILEALRNGSIITFTYAGFSRSRAETGIRFRTHLLKRYKQRWYAVGIREKSGDMRTYALDRMQDVMILNEGFEQPDVSEAEAIFSDIIGITSSKAPTRIVRLKATPRQAKYFRALPLHHSQSEELHNDYSIFTYKLKLNYELVAEIMALGNAVKVLDPPELRLMVTTRLREALEQY